MSKVKKSDLLNMIQEQNDVIAKLTHQVNCHHKDIIRIEGIVEPEPKLKQLDQSIFNGLDEKWRFAAVDKCGEVWACTDKVFASRDEVHLPSNNQDTIHIKGCYDASNWQNSLIERDTAKELLEVDLSNELTGSELCKAMLARGDKVVMCIVKDYEHENDIYYDAITYWSGDYFESTLSSWRCATPINNQGEPLTASEVGL